MERFVNVPFFHGPFVPYSSLGIALILTLERRVLVVSVAILVRVHDTYPTAPAPLSGLRG
jgi:hypothetical protein